MHQFPETLKRYCFRCKNHIMWADNPVLVWVQGQGVQMHASCKEKYDHEIQSASKEEEALPA